MPRGSRGRLVMTRGSRGRIVMPRGGWGRLAMLGGGRWRLVMLGGGRWRLVIQGSFGYFVHGQLIFVEKIEFKYRNRCNRQEKCKTKEHFKGKKVEIGWVRLIALEAR